MVRFAQEYKNTKYFHFFVQGRRRRLYLSEITSDRGDVFNTNTIIKETSMTYFTNQFQEDTFNQDISMLDCIPKLVTDEENENMTKLIKQDEVKQVIHELNGNSVTGPDNFFGLFFQKC